MIEFHNVHKTYRVAGKDIPALHSTNLRVEAGQVFGLIGHSGAGKSTLLRLINRLEEPTGGKIVVDGEEITALDANGLRRFRQQVGMIFQHFNLLASKTVADNVALPLTLAGELSRREIDQRVAELLQRVGLADHAKKYPSQLSGGQKQRVGIARALAVEPRLIVADECVAALDVSIQGQIVNLLLELRQRLNLSILFIAHDLAIVRRLCDRVAVMYLGQIVEEGSVEAVFGAPRHPYTAALIDSIPDIDPERRLPVEPLPGEPPSPLHAPSGCAFHPRCRLARPTCAEALPPTHQLEHQRYSCVLEQPLSHIPTPTSIDRELYA